MSKKKDVETLKSFHEKGASVGDMALLSGYLHYSREERKVKWIFLGVLFVIIALVSSLIIFY